MTSFHVNLGNRLVKSPKMHIRDAGLVHALLKIQSSDDLFGHAIIGASWGGHVIENLLRWRQNAPEPIITGQSQVWNSILCWSLPNSECWTIEMKLRMASKLERGYHQALENIKQDRAFVVYGGEHLYPKGHYLHLRQEMGLLEISLFDQQGKEKRFRLGAHFAYPHQSGDLYKWLKDYMAGKADTISFKERKDSWIEKCPFPPRELPEDKIRKALEVLN